MSEFLKKKYKIPELIKIFETKDCVSCGEPLQRIAYLRDEEDLVGWSILKYYEHPDGLYLYNETEPQWVYVVCNSCGYQNSFMKLGLKEEAE